MANFRALVLQRHRQLKWKAFDKLEAGLMVLCGVCIFMFTLAVFCDVLTRTLGAPWLWLQQVTTAFFAWGVFVGMAAATRRNDHFYLTEIKSVDDMKGKKVRVQATKTEDTHFPAYGSQTVHMPFGDVYTSLQTGVVNVAENGVNVYLANKHYEVAPVLSMTEHEANNNCLWVSDKTWNSLTPEQQLSLIHI